MHIVDPNHRASTLPQTASFGFVPYPADKQAEYAKAATMLHALSSDPSKPHDRETAAKQCVLLMRLFGSVSSQGDASWFLNSEMLGHPSPELAGRMISSVSAIGKAVKAGRNGALVNAVEAFNADFGYEMLDSYLDVALHGQAPVQESDWAYIVWSASRNEVLHIGATAETPREVAQGLSRATGQPYSVLAAWLVYDTEGAKEAIKEAFNTYRAGTNQYFVRLGAAKQVVEGLLKQRGDFVLSPWHAEGEPKPERSAVHGR